MTRKLITIGLVLTIALALVACKKEAAKITQVSDLEGKIVAAMSSPQDPAMVQAFTEHQTGVKLKDFRFFDTTSAAIAALKSYQVDAVFSIGPTSKFYTLQDNTLDFINMPPVGKSSVHMALRATDTELRNNINTALISMKEDGTLFRLEKEFITDLTPNQLLAGKDMPRFPDAPVFAVGVSGDLPPMDYAAANGIPAGYNVELLALLAEKLNVNFEISVLPAESKFPALAANRIDIFFFHLSNADVEVTQRTLQANNNAALTEPYYEMAEWGFLVLK